MTTKKVHLVRADNWTGLYIDGVLVEEGHDIQYYDLFKHLDIDGEILWCDEDWIHQVGRLPLAIEKVKRAKP